MSDRAKGRQKRPAPAEVVRPSEGAARAEVAYRYLRNAIISNELAVGFQAAENEIAVRLGMSRTPVHEAMARLQEEGFVQILPRKGILVRALTPADLLEVYDVLIALEGAAAGLLADNNESAAVGAVIAELEESTDAMDAALRSDDLNAWGDADERFHDALVAGCGNSRIAHMAATVSGQSHRARRLTLHLRPKPTNSASEHRTIIKAIRGADAPGAEEAARSHRRHARNQLMPLLKRMNFRQL